MAVAVTGANGLVGRATIPLLLAGGSEVRALVRRPETGEVLQKTGAKVAVAQLSDPGKLAYVFEGAHTVCHLAGGLDHPDDRAYERSNLETTVVVLEAARDAGVRRVLFLSYPGASPSAANSYLRAKGRAEEEIRASGIDHAIIRCTHVVGPGSEWLSAMRRAGRGPVAMVIGPGTQKLAPVFVGDVAAVLAASDDRATTVKGTWAIQGPQEMSADDYVDLLAGRRKPKVHLSVHAARLFGRLAGRRLAPTLLEILAADSLADAPDAAAEFGVLLTPLSAALRRSGEGE
ncbi:MAG: SDR family oxidoreductase [Actinomycetota bacterium]